MRFCRCRRIWLMPSLLAFPLPTFAQIKQMIFVLNAQTRFNAVPLLFTLVFARSWAIGVSINETVIGTRCCFQIHCLIAQRTRNQQNWPRNEHDKVILRQSARVAWMTAIVKVVLQIQTRVDLVLFKPDGKLPRWCKSSVAGSKFCKLESNLSCWHA